ncbi:MAG: fused MFS/spermidine synthase, partial [Actinomycetota bacterium]
GNAAGGRLADRFPPADLIGPALLVGGVFTWLAPLWARVLDPTPGAGPVTIIGLSAVLFFAPAVALSAITPLVAKLQLQSLDESGTVVGNLSAAGTAGALAGTFVTGFVLVASFGTRTLFVAVGAVLVAAGLAFTGSTRLRTNPLALVLAAAIGAGALVVGDRCQAETSYACADLVVDEGRPTGRSLVLNGDRNSYVDVDDPLFLDFRYARLFADVLAEVDSGPLEAVHIGGAGFTVPRYLEARRPGSDQVVLEIDRELVDFVTDELGSIEGPNLRVVVGDARLTMAEVPSDSQDVVFGDAFSGLTVPWHLTTTQFVADIDRVLRPGGVVMLNLIDGGDIEFARASLATYAEHFEHVALIEPPEGVPPTGAWNLIVIASDRPIGDLRIDPADGRMVPAATVAGYVAEGLVLDDDFAPVDQIRRAR